MGQIETYFTLTKGNGYFERRRREQARYWMYETIDEALKDGFYHNASVEAALAGYEQDVLDGNKSSFAAAKELLQLMSDNKG
jgi:LAO/AO transport system kinase